MFLPVEVLSACIFLDYIDLHAMGGNRVHVASYWRPNCELLIVSDSVSSRLVNRWIPSKQQSET